MLNKKSIIIFALGLLPLVANADLILTNSTKHFASATISNSGMCSGSIGGVLAPGASYKVSSGQIALVCGYHTPCSATLIVNDNANEAKSCKGVRAGSAQINNLTTDIITSFTVHDNHYKFTGQGTNHGTMSENN